MGKPELELLLSKYNSAMGWATIAVAIGIFGEYIAHFVFSKDEKRRRAEWACTVIFAVCVLGGVIGEWRYGEDLSGTATQLQRIADKEVADAQRDANLAKATAKGFESQIAASDARVKVAEAQVTSAMAASDDAVAKVAAADARSAEASAKAEGFRADIAKANQSAEQARAQVASAAAESAKANLELAKLKTPRSLTDIPGLVSALKAFRGTEFSFASLFGHDESFSFLKQIDEAFTEAGWKRIKQTKINLGIPAVTITGKDDLVGLGINSGVRFEVEATETLESLQSLPVDKLPSQVRIAVLVNNLMFAHIDPPETFGPDALVNILTGESKTIRVKVGKKL